MRERWDKRAIESLKCAIKAVIGRLLAPREGGSMATDCIAQVTFEFDPKRKPVVAAFDAEHASSDGGAILLKGIDTQFGLTKRVAACLDDPPHGQQELTFFNGHYDSWCYLPVVATVTFGAEAEQYAVAAVLRPGNAPASLGACGLLRRLIRQLRAAFRGPTIRVRLDGGFPTPTIFTSLHPPQAEYLVPTP